MSDWLLLDPRKVNPPVNKQIAGVPVTVSASLYDVPEAVRASSGKDTDKFVIDVRYLGSMDYDEPTKELRGPTDEFLKIGANSGRVYRMEFSPPAEVLTVDFFRKRVKGIIDFLRVGADKHRVQRYDVTERALINNSEEILGHRVFYSGKF